MTLMCGAAMSDAPAGLGPQGLDAAEFLALGRGEAIVRLPGSAAGLSLARTVEGGGEALDSVVTLKPNYLVEVVASIPRANFHNALSALAAALADVPGYVGIPYWSESFKKTYDLFDKAAILSRSARPDGGVIEALMHMKPFDDYRARYEWRLSEDSFSFSGANLDRLVYRGFAAVKPGEMLWRIVAYRSGDRVWFHGIGAVKAFDLFGAVRGKLEPSFIGRTKAFFESMQERMRGAAVPGIGKP